MGFLADSLPSRQGRGVIPLWSVGPAYLLTAGLLEPVPLERAYAAEKLAVRLAVLLSLVLDQGEFDGAEVIRHLLKAVAALVDENAELLGQWGLLMEWIKK